MESTSSQPDLIDRGEVIQISDSVEPSERASIALDRSNNPHFVWEEDDEIYYKALGGTQVNISNTETRSDLPVIAIDSADTIHVVWEEGWEDLSPPGWVYYSKSADSGQTWSTPVIVSDHPFTPSALHSNVVVDENDRVHIVWASGHSGVWKVYHRYVSSALSTI